MSLSTRVCLFAMAIVVASPPAAQPATPARVHARTRSRGVDDRRLPGPRDTRPGLAGEQIHRVVDYKVKANPINQPKADRDRRQACTSQAAGWRAGPFSGHVDAAP